MNQPLAILQGDALEMLKTLPSDSIPCCITSPPYDNLRTYGGHRWDFKGIAKELFRVLCDGGVLCWNVGDEVVKGSETLTSMRQAIYFVDEAGFRMHDTMIWHKLNFSSPSFNRYHQCFEYVFILSKGKPRCFNPIKDKTNATAGMVGNMGVNSFMKRDGTKSTRSKHVTADMGMRHNVWTGKTRGQEDMCEKLTHPAMMPKWLAKDLILSWSNTGDTILDPFFGSGTSGMMAIEVGRKAIGIEINPEYASLAKQNCNVTPGLAL